MTHGKKCPHCGQMAMTVKKHEHEEQVGPFKVADGTATALVCGSCGAASLSMAEAVAYERRAARVTLTERPDANGAVLKYARKALGLRQQDLALLLGAASETLSRYENDHDKTPRAIQLAVAGLLDGVETKRINMDAMVEAAQHSLPPPPPSLQVPATLRRAV
jgi:DNA-binding XRE family transcriptional regulator